MTYLVLSFAIMGLMLLATRNVRSTFSRYAKVPVRSRLTGAQVARQVLDSHGLHHVRIERIEGELTDHYDPREKVLRLSEPVYDHASLAAAGVAAHEAGHALQDKHGYLPLQYRQGIYPLANFGSSFGVLLIPLGLMAGVILGPMGFWIALMGFILYLCAVLFSVITLPVEFNASSRAMAALSHGGIVSSHEYRDTEKVLNAAAMTYVAATIGAVVTLLYYGSLLFGGAEE
ncbi:MAG: zinc metallopeptidase [Candidatus Omnitrophota bacterium]|nr:MAG: zinc metallopeptidase [Candidatus Omnitrophota bacterium]